MMTSAASDFSSFYATQPLAAKAFEQGLTQKRLSHGLLLTGQPTWQMYQLVMTAYKVMACDQPVSRLQACHACRSCKWMAQNAHPHFITVSPLSFFVESGSAHDARAEALTAEEANKLLKNPPSQIHVGQVRYLLQQLSLQAGQYPRMIVFTDAQMTPSGAASQKQREEQHVTAPYDWASLPDAEGCLWQPKPLKRSLFNPSSANRFLKTLEEPGANTHFVFLAQQAEDVMATIQSRCQVLPFQPVLSPTGVPEAVEQFWLAWMDNPKQLFPHQWLQRLLTDVLEKESDAPAFLHSSFEWIHAQRAQWQDSATSSKWIDFAHKLHKVEEMLRNHVSFENSFLTVFSAY